VISLRITGLEGLNRRFKKSPILLNREVKKSLGKIVSMIEGESKRRTPVDSGLLRSSIGGSRGWKWVKGWTASVGTNVKYAMAVHEGHGRHNIGERKYMEKGAEASKSFIQKQMKRAMDNLARELTR